MTRRKINKLLEELRILTPRSVTTRWRIIYAMLILLIEKVRRGMEYRDAYLRPWEITAKVRQPSSINSLIDMLVKFNPQILKPLEKVRRAPETHFTKSGVSILRNETEIWKEIFKLTDAYDMLKPLVEIFRQRLDEIDGYIQESGINQTKSN